MTNVLTGDVTKVARSLLGCYLVRTINGKEMVAQIVETEGYHQSDAASHSFRGKTKRNAVMFDRAGLAYVYFTYGMHYCFNVVVGKTGEASAVLVRATEPIEGLDTMRLFRPGKEGPAISNGPAKLCQAMKIDTSLNGHDLSQPPLQLIIKPPLKPQAITATTRIGISKETQKPWRFYITDNPFVSVK